MIFTIKNIIRGWPDKSQNIVFKSTKAFDVLHAMVKIVNSTTAEGKKNF